MILRQLKEKGRKSAKIINGQKKSVYRSALQGSALMHVGRPEKQTGTKNSPHLHS